MYNHHILYILRLRLSRIILNYMELILTYYINKYNSPTPNIFLFPGDLVFPAWGRRFPFQRPGASKFAPPSNKAWAAAVLFPLTAKNNLREALPACGYGSIPIDTFLVGWTSIYQLFWGSLGTRVLTHPHVIMSFTHLAVAQNCFDTWTHKMLFIRKNCQVHPLFWDSEFDPGQIWTKNGQTIPPRENQKATLLAAQQRSFPIRVHNVGVQAFAHQISIIVSTWPLRAA